MIIIGQGHQPHWVWVSAARVQRVRARLAVTGMPLIGMALVFGIVLVAVGLNLPTSHHPINVIGVMTAGLAAIWALLSGLSLATGRSCARGEFVDVKGLAWFGVCSGSGGVRRSSAWWSRGSPR